MNIKALLDDHQLAVEATAQSVTNLSERVETFITSHAPGLASGPLPPHVTLDDAGLCLHVDSSSKFRFNVGDVATRLPRLLVALTGHQPGDSAMERISEEVREVRASQVAEKAAKAAAQQPAVDAFMGALDGGGDGYMVEARADYWATGAHAGGRFLRLTVTLVDAPRKTAQPTGSVSAYVSRVGDAVAAATVVNRFAGVEGRHMVKGIQVALSVLTEAAMKRDFPPTTPEPVTSRPEAPSPG